MSFYCCPAHEHNLYTFRLLIEALFNDAKLDLWQMAGFSVSYLFRTPCKERRLRFSYVSYSLSTKKAAPIFLCQRLPFKSKLGTYLRVKPLVAIASDYSRYRWNGYRNCRYSLAFLWMSAGSFHDMVRLWRYGSRSGCAARQDERHGWRLA